MVYIFTFILLTYIYKKKCYFYYKAVNLICDHPVIKAISFVGSDQAVLKFSLIFILDRFFSFDVK